MGLGVVFGAVLGVDGGGEHWDQALFEGYGAADDSGKQIRCIGKQGLAENKALRLILP